MFGLAWSEVVVIGVVALIAIGPKDLPLAIKACAETVKKARRMASEFQGHVDEMVREANLHEVRDQIDEVRNMDIKSKILNAVDDDASLRRTIDGDGFKPGAYVAPSSDISVRPTAPVPDPALMLIEPTPILTADMPQPTASPAPAFIPPGTERPLSDG